MKEMKTVYFNFDRPILGSIWSKYSWVCKIQVKLSNLKTIKNYF